MNLANTLKELFIRLSATCSTSLVDLWTRHSQPARQGFCRLWTSLFEPQGFMPRAIALAESTVSKVSCQGVAAWERWSSSKAWPALVKRFPALWIDLTARLWSRVKPKTPRQHGLAFVGILVCAFWLTFVGSDSANVARLRQDGELLLYNVGVKPEHGLAGRLLEAAAAAGDARAHTLLGIRLTTGRGCAVNLAEAVSHFKEGSAHDPCAAVLLARHYACGLGVRRSKDRAKRLFESNLVPLQKKIQEHDALALQIMAEELQSGILLEKNESLAYRMTERAAMLDHPPAMQSLAEYLISSRVVAPDWQRAETLFQQQAASGDGQALCGLARLHTARSFQPFNFRSFYDRQNAYQCFESAAATGFPSALAEFANCLLSWQIFEAAQKLPLAECQKKAHTMLLKSVEDGCAFGAYRLGKLYEFGEGVPADATKAAEWYGRAAEMGALYALEALQKLKSGEGNGVTQESLNKAIEELQMVARPVLGAIALNALVEFLDAGQAQEAPGGMSLLDWQIDRQVRRDELLRKGRDGNYSTGERETFVREAEYMR